MILVVVTVTAIFPLIEAGPQIKVGSLIQAEGLTAFVIVETRV